MNFSIFRNSPRLRVGLLFLGLTSFLHAAPPGWWSAGNPPVITGGAPENHGVANQGQAKYMAKQALAALRAKDPYAADDIEEALVGPGRAIVSWAPPSTPEESARQYAPLLIGQLKAISAPFYQKLNQKLPVWIEEQLSLNHTKDLADSSNYFPWTSSNADDNNREPATIGQLKAVFSLRFESIGVHVFVDADADGMDDTWEQAMIDLSANPIVLTDFLPGGDLDGDGVTNLQEYLMGFNAAVADTDNDGYSDRLSVDQALFFKLDEGSGTAAVDSSANARSGTLSGSPAWQSAGGVSKGALQFHGSSDAAQFPAAALDSAGSFTLSLWFKTSSTSNQTFLSAAGATQLPALALGLNGGNILRLEVAGGAAVNWTYPRSLADGLWHHLVVIRDASAALATVRVDGAVFGANQSVPATALDVDVAVLGQKFQSVSSYDTSRSFNGSLDEVRIWFAALAPQYVSELFRPNDLDQDGLPDDWERSKATDLTTFVGTAGDADGDGRTDRQEFESGSNPLNYYNGLIPVITLVSGGGQSVYNGDRTLNPLVFLVTDGTNPLPNAPVDLNHPGVLGALETVGGNQLATSLNLRTGTDGKVSVHFKAN